MWFHLTRRLAGIIIYIIILFLSLISICHLSITYSYIKKINKIKLKIEHRKDRLPIISDNRHSNLKSQSLIFPLGQKKKLKKNVLFPETRLALPFCPQL